MKIILVIIGFLLLIVLVNFIYNIFNSWLSLLLIIIGFLLLVDFICNIFNSWLNLPYNNDNDKNNDDVGKYL